MHLDFKREFDAPAEVVWAHLCEPDLMNLWSEGRVELVEAGQGQHPGGPGAHRRVHVQAGGRRWVLNEVIRDSQPGETLRYQIVDAAALRSHLGVIHIEESNSTSTLRWDVDFEFLAPGLAPLAARILRTQLGRSLDKLGVLLRTPPTPSRVQPAWRAVPSPTEQDWARGRSILATQQALARKLDAQSDPKRIFAHVYSYVSEGILDGCEAGRFVYPAWALRLLPPFHDYYWRNHQRWCGHDAGPVESHWRRAFHVAENGTSRYPGQDGQMISGLILSIHAHVESDLPRTLAEVYVDHFSESSDYARFRGDYYCMGQVFIDSTKKIQSLIPKSFIPMWAKAVRGVMPEEIIQQLIYSRSYNLPKERRAAFRRGAEMADMLMRRRNVAKS